MAYKDRRWQLYMQADQKSAGWEVEIDIEEEIIHLKLWYFKAEADWGHRWIEVDGVQAVGYAQALRWAEEVRGIVLCCLREETELFEEVK